MRDMRDIRDLFYSEGLSLYDTLSSNDVIGIFNTSIST